MNQSKTTLPSFPDPDLDLRFWSQVRVTDGCWLWTSYHGSAGYGRINHKGSLRLVHRLMFQLCHGPIPFGLFVCHTCDVRHCVNPAHLFCGTAEANTQDMMKKKRHRVPKWRFRVVGERHGMSKLTAEQVVEIRRRYLAGGITQVQLAEEFNVSSSHICGVVNGKFWSDPAAMRPLSEKASRTAETPAGQPATPDLCR